MRPRQWHRVYVDDIVLIASAGLLHCYPRHHGVRRQARGRQVDAAVRLHVRPEGRARRVRRRRQPLGAL